MLCSGLAQFLQTKDEMVLVAQQKAHQLLLLLLVAISPHFLVALSCSSSQSNLIVPSFIAVQEINTKNDILVLPFRTHDPASHLASAVTLQQLHLGLLAASNLLTVDCFDDLVNHSGHCAWMWPSLPLFQHPLPGLFADFASSFPGTF